jgi:uncharacterized protein with HEPN domain
MRSERDNATIREILDHIDLAENFGKGRSFTGADDLMPLYAVIRCLEIISEASRRLSPELKARHAEIPWREMAAAGNVYRHKYEDVLPQRVSKTLARELPLRTALEQELGEGG